MVSVSGPGGGRLCANGHPVPAGHRFCAQCGSAAVDPDATVALPAVDPTAAHGIPAHPPGGAHLPTVAATPPPDIGAYPPTAAMPGAAPPPPPAPPTPSGPVPLPPHEINRRPGPGRGPLIAMAVAGLLLIGGLGTAAALLTTHNSGHQATGSATTVDTSPTSVSSSTTTTSTTVPSSTSTGLQDAAGMTAIAGDLSQSAAVRPAVQNAINGVISCSVDPGTGEASLQHSIDTRQGILTSLTGVEVSGIPQGQTMLSDLQQALTDSIQADHDYQKWMEDEASSGQCNTDPTGDSNFQAGQAASAQATAAKSAFLAIWNPLAPSYGEPTYTATQI